MTCRDARELFSALVDDVLAPEGRALCTAHLASCAECRRELDRFEKTVGVLRAVVPVRAPAGFVDRVVQAAQPAPWYQRVLRRFFLPLHVKIPLEATAVVLVAVAAVYVFQHSPELEEAARGSEPVAQSPPAGLGSSRVEGEAAPPMSGEKAPAVPGEAPSTARKVEGARAQSEDATKAKEAERLPAPPPAAPAPPAEKLGAEAEQKAPPPSPAAPPVAEPAPSLDRSESGPAREQRGDAAPDTLKGTARQGIAARSLPASQAVGRLIVEDPESAIRALAALVARVGGTEVGRRQEAGTGVIEILVPREAYGELTRGLAEIGRWSPDQEPASLPEQVRLTVRVTR
jgi:anti-sigma factor RsiW